MASRNSIGVLLRYGFFQNRFSRNLAWETCSVSPRNSSIAKSQCGSKKRVIQFLETQMSFVVGTDRYQSWCALMAPIQYGCSSHYLLGIAQLSYAVSQWVLKLCWDRRGQGCCLCTFIQCAKNKAFKPSICVKKAMAVWLVKWNDGNGDAIWLSNSQILGYPWWLKRRERYGPV